MDAWSGERGVEGRWWGEGRTGAGLRPRRVLRRGNRDLRAAQISNFTAIVTAAHGVSTGIASSVAAGIWAGEHAHLRLDLCADQWEYRFV